MRTIIISVLTGMLLLLTSCSLNDLTGENKQSNNNHQANEQTTENDQSNSPENADENDGTIKLDKKYFNIVAEQDGKEVIQNVDNLLILVNKQSAYLPADYVPANLVRPNVRFSFGDLDIEKSYLKEEAARALEKMFQQAEVEGISLYAVSGYRSYTRQTEVFQREVEAKGEEKAVEAVAIPGQSEHQTGLAMDISAESANLDLVESFESTPEGTWLRENAHKFGFILRYPKGKEAITGYQYEPWHFRYVGEETAKIIYENDWTLEEFFQNAKAV
ncbi:M15 family metallopeptidase [Caldifermentibacillus hisashii]|jgi:D-alanyl-D-alanine carboxypeptidase|uniref:M15 family metallopeptidase n=1 Tax=Caldifermentibacillus hisashii TaxID=996558 RepID=A0ABU9JYL1_9BACI|nr:MULTISPECIES: M15 family metallopeptidase [Bacillaceae]MCB7070410.1 M15 family metallopeptidase [Caldibacillus sp. 210928-DFI.2.22]MCB7073710.1 M15 family metallopeptidase [Caldibacillus sp. 210928-DFI.2.18]MCM3477041.1 M15 family metallopeptidase [Caldibacillus thermoamylovorans]MEC5271009.1 M15 family metallopeptidase [Caldifermentibacillus hisashii]MED4851450.1 M15 family metallopeptidase [Caldifermentibacillus hisashii]